MRKDPKISKIIVLISLIILISFPLITYQISSVKVISYFSDLGIASLSRLDRREINEINLLSRHNQYRLLNGLEPLKIDQRLNATAKIKAAYMAKNHCWSHKCPELPFKSMIDSGYIYHFAGENLAFSFETMDGLMNAWMASPEHKSNILKPEYRDVGFSIVRGDLLNEKNSILVVVHFGAL